MHEQNSIHHNNSNMAGYSAINADPFLTELEAAAYLRVSLPTIRRRRYEGTGPRYIRVGEISYRRSWLEEYIRRTSKPPAGPVSDDGGGAE